MSAKTIIYVTLFCSTQPNYLSIAMIAFSGVAKYM